MNEDLHRHLDGDYAGAPLADEARLEAQAWERLLDAFRVEVPPAAAPPWLESRVMEEIEALPEPGVLRQLGSWMVRPHPVRVSPLFAGLAAAVLAILFLVRSPGPGSSRPGETGFSPGTPGAQAGLDRTRRGLDQAQAVATVVYVQFVLDAPGASSVAVAGDFDGWKGSYVLADPDGDGTWTGQVPLRTGVHAYMFLVDGSTWMTDPRAQRYAEDGFGNRNAILAVATPTT
jgi:hypothetical protein